MSHEITIIFRGVELDVQYDYEPAQEQSFDYEQLSESIDILDITHKGVSLSELLEDQEQLDHQIIEKIKEQR